MANKQDLVIFTTLLENASSKVITSVSVRGEDEIRTGYIHHLKLVAGDVGCQLFGLSDSSRPTHDAFFSMFMVEDVEAVWYGVKISRINP